MSNSDYYKFIGFIIGNILVLIGIIEWYAWEKKINTFEKPIKIGVLSGLTMGFVFVVIMQSQASGEAGLIGIGLAPIILFVYAIAGLIIGAIYKSYDRIIIIKANQHK